MRAMPDWPLNGIAIEGDFSGIQRFVLRPVPGAGGAARRLRARSFRVLALTRLIAEIVVNRFREAVAQMFYSAGGKFLVVAQPLENWRAILSALQEELDREFLRAGRGELVFHLAGAEFQGGKIPVTVLHHEMQRRKQRPLSGVLCTNSGWATEQFLSRATYPAKCTGCGATASIADESEDLCETCVEDRELGKELLRARSVALTRSPAGPIALLGERWSIAPDGPIPISLISHSPLTGDQLATFEDLSARAVGRPYLAFLRLDADRIGEEFRKLSGDPSNIWALSNRLNDAFSLGVGAVLRERFPNLYPVYGGGDDLFVIGPWSDVLDFVVAWRAKFAQISGGKLTFSAGVALAKPRQHILTKSEEAEHALNDQAKRQRDSIHVLGATIPFSQFADALGFARELAELVAKGKVKRALLHNIVDLHDCWRGYEVGGRERDARWHSLLFYQLERNVDGAAKPFITNAFLSPGALWPHAGFAARYAMLRTAGEDGTRYA